MTLSEFRHADRIGNVKIPDIVKMAEATRKRRAEGHDVISLGIGEPDFRTPDHVNDAAIKAIRDGDTRYPPIPGKPLLREAVANLYEGTTAENVLISSGAKYSIFNCFMATINEGDEVILPAPYWTSYTDIVTICGGVPVNLLASAEDKYRLNIDKLRAAITDRTRWILINSPSNPTGTVISPEVMTELGKLLEEHPQCWLMSDEIYQHLIYDAEFTSAYTHLPHLRDRMLIINGVSKAYAMTGWRVGFGIGPVPLIKAMTVAQTQGTSGTCSIAQAAALAALEGPQDLLAERCASLRARRDLVLSYLDQMNGILTHVPEGAFYIFSSWTALEGGVTPSGQVLKTDRDFCEYLLDTANVAVIPGSGFAAPGHFRISYACSTEELNTALSRMKDAVNAISTP
jgi:aspartate aminotransferase